MDNECTECGGLCGHSRLPTAQGDTVPAEDEDCDCEGYCDYCQYNDCSKCSRPNCTCPCHAPTAEGEAEVPAEPFLVAEIEGTTATLRDVSKGKPNNHGPTFVGEVWHEYAQRIVDGFNTLSTTTAPTPVADERLKEIQGRLDEDYKFYGISIERATLFMLEDVRYLLTRLSQAEAELRLERDAKNSIRETVEDQKYQVAELRQQNAELTAQVESVRRETWGKAENIAAMPSPFTTESGLNDGWREASERIVIAIREATWEAAVKVARNPSNISMVGGSTGDAHGTAKRIVAALEAAAAEGSK